MPFELITAGRIVFGRGAVAQAPPAAAALAPGGGALLVTGRRAEPAERLAAALAEAGLRVTRFVVPGEPTVELAQAGAAAAREAGAGVVIGLGGGSALDGAKAIAALATNPGDPLDYLEVIGRGRPLSQAPLPVIAAPTTAGTGSEVTRNAVLASPGHRVKVSLRSPLMLPRLAVVDPALTDDLPPALTASTGLDALTQLLEPYVSHAASPLTDPLCLDGLARAARSLRRAYHAGARAPEARDDLALASLFGGLALANAKLGAVHGLAGPLGGWLPGAAHGDLCARLLPEVTAANWQALARRAPGHPAQARYASAARILTGREAATPADLVAWLRDLVAELGVPGLAELGLAPADVPAIVAQAQAASSMKGNPLPLTDQELAGCLIAALEPPRSIQ